MKYITNTNKELPNINEFKKILIVKVGGAGDALLITPMLREIKRNNPNCFLEVLTSKPEIISCNMFIDKISKFDIENYNLENTKIFELLEELVPYYNEFDLAINARWDTDFYGCLLFSRLSINYKLGYTTSLYNVTDYIEELQDYGIFNEFDVYTHSLNQDWKFLEHDVILSMKLLHYIPEFTIYGLELDFFYESKKTYEEIFGISKEELGNYVVFNIGSNIPERRWNIKNFNKLAEYINKKYGYKIVYIGGNESLEDSKYICENNYNIISLNKSIEDTMFIVQNAKYGVSNNSLFLHAFSVFKIPVVEICAFPKYWDEYRPGTSTRFSCWNNHTVIVQSFNKDKKEVRVDDLPYNRVQQAFDYLTTLKDESDVFKYNSRISINKLKSNKNNYKYGIDVEFPTDYEKNSETYSNKLETKFYINLFSDINELPSLNIDLNPDNKDIIDICTPIDTTIDMVYYNCKYIKKYMKSPYHHTIFDNRNSEEDSKQIIEICKEFNCSYIKTPNLWELESNSNYILGMIYNFILYEYIYKRNCKYFGLVEGDIFLRKDFDIISILKNKECYGRIHKTPEILNQKDSEIWYLWCGFSFYKTEKFSKLDFIAKHSDIQYDMGVPFYETGGRNYFKYFYNMDKNIVGGETKDFKFVEIIKDHLDFELNKTNYDSFEMNKIRSSCIEQYDSCYHLMNAAKWVYDPLWDKKWELTKKFLEENN